MTQQVFADYIGQSPATVSSIFTGRTRPSLNIVEAIKKKIPNISTDWLMFGTGDMYVAESGTPEVADNNQNPASPTRMQPESPMLDFDSPVAPVPQNAPAFTSNINSVRNTRAEIVREEVKMVDKPQRRVKEIRVFYDDQTWETFVPEKK